MDVCKVLGGVCIVNVFVSICVVYISCLFLVGIEVFSEFRF